jgi:DNA processing protein
LITAYMANDYGRDVYVLPGTLDNPRATGCLGLMSKGAQLILGEGHLLELLGTIPTLDRPQTINAPVYLPNLSPELSAIFTALQELCQTSGQPSVSFDQLIQGCQKPASAVSSALLQLELLGLVTQLPGMKYALASSL